MAIKAVRRRTKIGALVLGTGALCYALYPGGSESDSGVDLVAAAERHPDPAPALPPPPQQIAAPAPAADGLRLHGLTATGAIVDFPGGGQRLVAIGREVLPGLKLEAVRQHHALLTSPAGAVRLGFSGPESAGEAPEAAALSAAPTRSPQPSREETLGYRFGLAPRRAGGRITGYVLRAGAQMPLLRRAGLKAGDVLIGVNGQTFDSDEKVMELASEIAGSYTAEFEFERNGRRMRASLPVNPRP